MAKQSATKAQDKQKEWYDKYSRERSFSPGEQVLVLLPTTENKLLARFRGPHVVTRRISDVNYEVAIGSRLTILHINLLKKGYARDSARDSAHVDLGVV